jgi:hypothetical protein
MQEPIQQKPLLIVWWVLWFAILSGTVIIYIFLRRPVPEGADQSLWYLPLLPFIVSSVLRLVVLPKFNDWKQAFPFFIIGMAMAEACVILGLFIVPALGQAFFILGVFAQLLYVPYFAKKFE